MTGESLLQYEILDQIGKGGMGVVYLARDVRLGRTVALKVLPPGQSADPKRKQRFLREARAAAALNHPNIVGLYEIGADRGVDFIAMEFVPGESLHAKIQRGRLALAEISSYAAQIAAALAKAHASGVVHRDLKPGNIMITPEGEVKLLDFGLAQLSHHQTPSKADSEKTETLSELTQIGSVQGTVAYMSPEQARGEAVDKRSDIFSFGVVLYEMLTGFRPFQGNNTVSILHAIAFEQPAPVERLRTETPAALVEILGQCIEKHPEHRAQSMDAILAGFRSLSDAPTTASAAGLAAAVAKPRRWWPYAAVAAGTLAISLGDWTLTHRGSPESRADAPELVRQGRGYLMRYDKVGNTDRALSAFQRAVQQDPSNAAAYAGLADAYVYKHAANPDPQLLQLAHSHASRAIELNPLLSVAHQSMGAALLAEGKPKEAEPEQRRALELDPNSFEAQLDLGETLASEQRAKDAEDVYRKLIAAQPGDWRAYHFLCSLLFRVARYEDAAAACEQATAKVQDNSTVYRLLGSSYAKLGRNSDAIGAYQKALAIRPTAALYSAIGSVYFYEGRYRDAQTAFQNAVSFTANDPLNWDNLGDAYRYLPGNEEKAKQAYREAARLAQERLAKSPNALYWRVRLILYLAKEGQKDQARARIQALGEPAELEPGWLFQMGIASELLGDRAKAIHYLAEAAKAGFSISEMNADPDLTELRRDPRYHLEVLTSPATSKEP